MAWDRGRMRKRAWWWLALALAAMSAPAGADSSASAPVVELRLPADIVYGRAGSDSAVTFSHQSHVGYVENRCVACHPQLFPMLQRGPVPNHGAMNAGGSCGSCHNGEKAFGVKDAGSCANCHSGAASASASNPPGAAATAAGGSTGARPAGAPGGPPARKLPAPHAYPQSENSPGKVTFRHESHLKGAGSCTTCHPKLFPMAPQAPRPNGGMHEPTACGACHNGTKAFGVEDTDACTRCHQETGARP